MRCCQPLVFNHSQSLVTYWLHMVQGISYDWSRSSYKYFKVDHLSHALLHFVKSGLILLEILKKVWIEPAVYNAHAHSSTVQWRWTDVLLLFSGSVTSFFFKYVSLIFVRIHDHEHNEFSQCWREEWFVHRMWSLSGLKRGNLPPECWYINAKFIFLQDSRTFFHDE